MQRSRGDHSQVPADGDDIRGDGATSDGKGGHRRAREVRDRQNVAHIIHGVHPTTHVKRGEHRSRRIRRADVTSTLKTDLLLPTHDGATQIDLLLPAHDGTSKIDLGALESAESGTFPTTLVSTLRLNIGLGSIPADLRPKAPTRTRTHTPGTNRTTTATWASTRHIARSHEGVAEGDRSPQDEQAGA